MAYNNGDVSSVTFGNCSLTVNNITPTKIDSTIKQTLGKRISKHNIPGRDALDLRLQINGIIYDAPTITKEDQRTALKALQDGIKHHYYDGEHTASMVIENEGLNFDDTADQIVTAFRYNLSLVEWEGS